MNPAGVDAPGYNGIFVAGLDEAGGFHAGNRGLSSHGGGAQGRKGPQRTKKGGLAALLSGYKLNNCNWLQFTSF